MQQRKSQHLWQYFQEHRIASVIVGHVSIVMMLGLLFGSMSLFKFGAFAATNCSGQSSNSSDYVAMANQYAAEFGLNPQWFRNQIDAESSFNPNAGSPAGAEGIAQFVPETAASIGIDPWQPAQALCGAAQLMSNLNAQYGGDYAKALAAYNAGPGTVDYAVSNCGANWRGCIPYETQQYIPKIMGT